MMWGGDGFGGIGTWFGMGLMMFFWLLVLIGVVLLIVWLVRSSQGGGMAGHSGTASACDIAKQRYARGEISKEEYYDICRTVGG